MIELLIPLLTTVVGYAIRHYLGSRTWKLVQRLAAAIVADPNNDITDPEEAVQKAMAILFQKHLQDQADKLKSETPKDPPSTSGNAARDISKDMPPPAGMRRYAMLLLVLLFFTSCGGRQAKLREAMVSADIMSQTFSTYDAMEQQSIVEQSKSREQVEQELNSWRAKQLIAEYTIATVYRLIGAAATNDSVPILSATNALLVLRQTLEQMGIKLP